MMVERWLWWRSNGVVAEAGMVLMMTVVMTRTAESGSRFDYLPIWPRPSVDSTTTVNSRFDQMIIYGIILLRNKWIMMNSSLSFSVDLRAFILLSLLLLFVRKKETLLCRRGQINPGLWLSRLCVPDESTHLWSNKHGQIGKRSKRPVTAGDWAVDRGFA